MKPGFVIWGYIIVICFLPWIRGEAAAEKPKLDETQTVVSNQSHNTDVLRCPMAKSEFILCRNDQQDEGCVCNYDLNSDIRSHQHCLRNLTSNEYFFLHGKMLIYLRIKYQNMSSIKNDLFPELESPLTALAVNMSSQRIVYVQCVPDVAELAVTFEILASEADQKIFSIDWKESFRKTFSETGKIEIQDAQVFDSYYIFMRFARKLMNEKQYAVLDKKVFIILLAFVIIVVAVGLFFAVIFLFKWLDKFHKMSPPLAISTVSFRTLESEL